MVALPQSRRWGLTLLRMALFVVLALLGLAVLGAAGLAWRLSQGPLTVTHLATFLANRALSGTVDGKIELDRATLAWHGFGQGAGNGLDVVVDRVRVVHANAAPGPSLQHGEVTVSLLRLLQGELVPRSLALTGLHFAALRRADGSLALTDAADEPPSASTTTTADVTDALRRPANTDRASLSRRLNVLTQLRLVTLQDIDVALDDVGSHTDWRLAVASLDLRRQPSGGVNGSAQARIGAAGISASLKLTAALAPDGGTQLSATLAKLPLAPVSQSVSAAPAVPFLDAALQGTVAVELRPDLRVRHADVQLATEAGSAVIGHDRVAFDRLALGLAADWPEGAARPRQVTLKTATAVLNPGDGAPPTTIAASGRAALADSTYDATLHLTLDQASFGDLGLIWPADLGRNVRSWLVGNVSAGSIHDGDVQLSLTAPANALADFDVTAASGSLQGSDVTIYWLRPMPPIEHAEAVLTVKGPDVIDIAVPSGVQGKLTLHDGLLHITGLTAHDQIADISTHITGPVTDVMQLLSQPRLHLFEKRPAPVKPSAGTLAALLTVHLPLRKAVSFDEIGITASGHMAGLRLPDLIGKRDLDRGEIDYRVTQDGLDASGTATVAGFAGQVAVESDFRSGAPEDVILRASFAGTAGAAQLRPLLPEVVTSGSVHADADYSTRRDGGGSASIKADLTDAGLSLLGWTKPPGPAASAHAAIVLKHDKIAGISDLGATGPDLVIAADVETVGNTPRVLHLHKLVLGPTRASGEVRFPERAGEPIVAKLSGPELDLGKQLDGFGGGGSGKSTPFHAEAQFGTVLLGAGRQLRGVSATVDDDGLRLTHLELTATGPEHLRASIEPSGRMRRVAVRSNDVGALLAALGVTTEVHGGALTIDGEFDDRLSYSPLTATAEVNDFSVEEGVTIGKVLQAVTIYGIPEAMKGSGLQFARLHMPFRYDRRQLHIGETRAYSASLGVTASGWIDFARKIMDVRGTIVPAYAINSALGKIPLIGRVFSPERGGGLVAVNYVVNGSSTDPKISVNPLSALTPGFLRGLFNMFN